MALHNQPPCSRNDHVSFDQGPNGGYRSAQQGIVPDPRLIPGIIDPRSLITFPTEAEAQQGGIRKPSIIHEGGHPGTSNPAQQNVSAGVRIVV